ncbi:hypothetical protein BDV93DRAFT_523221 [Ceratobasidium sp. AG-I]|nr:hypothetical protein BDV93DRAFT_523221 [Ceratobasidium sp. AG-I]
MFFDCKADFIACALLSSFTTITEADRDAVEYTLELVASYDIEIGKLRMTRDAHVLAQIYLAQLRVMASRHNYTHDGSLEDITQARALMSVIVVPLLRHLSISEYEDIIVSLDRAEVLLSYPLEELNKLVASWRIQNIIHLTNWTSLPLNGADSYHFGAPAPVQGFQLEETLTPLPYPTKILSLNRLSALIGSKVPYEAQSSRDDIPSHFNNISSEPSAAYRGQSYVALPLLAGDERRVSWASSSSGSTRSETWKPVDQKLWVCEDHEHITPVKLSEHRIYPERRLIYGQDRSNDREHASKFPSRRKILRHVQSRVKALLMAL